MKKSYLYVGLAVVSMGIFAFQNDAQMQITQKFSGGVSDGRSGAPGEQNNMACTNCHAGSTLDGSQENSLTVLNSQFQPVTMYNPGDTYTVSIQMTSDPAKKGFNATALDGTDAMAGGFTGSGIGGTQDYQTLGRDYVTHTATSNTDSQTAWLWTWTAPATNVGDVTFYVATNSANNDGGTSGDMIYLSQHVIGSVASVNDQEISLNSFNAGYSPASNAITVDFTSLTAGRMSFNLVDMNGKSVYSKTMLEANVGENEHTIALPTSIENGIYVVNFFVGNNPMSAKVLVQK
ncbi:MAG: choice-of-anchor V domain-containing protein [Fluviicola sp.]